MIGTNRYLAIAVVVQGIAAAPDELLLFSDLLKRQEPGSPAYKCHEACGQAIIDSRSSDDVCNDDVFLADYNSCLQCSGPDGSDIWKYYGGTLSGVGKSCGLPTNPGDAQGIPSTGPISTTVLESKTSSSAITIATATTEPTTTSGEVSTTPVMTKPTTNGTSTTTGPVQVPSNAANTNTLPGHIYLPYGAAIFGALYVIAH